MLVYNKGFNMKGMTLKEKKELPEMQCKKYHSLNGEKINVTYIHYIMSLERAVTGRISA